MTKPIAFLHNMVTGEFVDSRTYAVDNQIERYHAELVKALGNKDSYLEVFAQAVVLTKSLTFNWLDGVPDTWRTFETFWGMVKNGVAPGECFTYYGENVDNVIMLGQNERYRIERITQTDIDAGLKDRITVDDGVLYKSALAQVGIKGWNRASQDALTSWLPPDAWKLIGELPKDKQTDPLS